MPDDVKLADYCRDVVAKLLKNEILLPDSIPHIDEEATLADHLLTTSALVACLAYGDAKRDLLRLAALVHDMPVEQRQATLGTYADAAAPWIELLEQQRRAIEEGKEIHIAAVGSERALLLAHLAASKREPIQKRDDFKDHPLNTGDQVALVYGGATKIKGYVSESAKLPEIRGASVLLDHINQLDLPAMWGRLPMMIMPQPLLAHQSKNRALSHKHKERYHEVREWFADHFIMNALDAPECIIYASGGNILALAPASWGARLATAIEYRYTDVTKVANSVGVAQCFSLLELQYGCNPTRFWVDDAKKILKSDSEAAKLLERSLGRSSDDQKTPFVDKKNFGELVTVLTGLANRRRAGDGTHTGEYRFTSFFQLSSHARKCMSCDIRPATDELEGARFFCDACLVKQQVGRWARKGDLWQPDYKWIRPWGTWLEEQQNVTIQATTDDLQEIGQLSEGFVGLISADGNDVGAYIAKLTSISGYRNFSKKMLEANEEAVAKALVKYVQPKNPQKDSWAFEVIAIGGDDVILFVPADKAIEVAKYIAQEFEAGLKDKGITGITLSAGVLIMPQSTPVRFGIELAHSLLASSKKIRYTNKSIGATVDFMALKSVTMVAESIELYRKVALEHKERQNLRFTQRPYTLEQLQQVISATRALKAANFPRSQLYQLAHYIREGLLMRSAVDYAYLVQRGKERSSSKEAFKKFDEEMIDLCNGNTWLPWRKSEECEVDYDSPLLDIIELYPFIAGSQEGEEA